MQQANPAQVVQERTLLDVAQEHQHSKIEALLRARTPHDKESPEQKPQEASLQPPRPTRREHASTLEAVLEEEEEEEEEDHKEGATSVGSPQGESADALEGEGEASDGALDEDDTQLVDSQIAELEAADTWAQLADVIARLESVEGADGAAGRRGRKRQHLPAQLETALGAARERLKRLRLAESMDPLYSFAAELPADFRPWEELKPYSAHTVLVVDCSGSMRNDDVATGNDGEYIARFEAVRRVLLESFVRGQLAAGAQPSERVSLIKIQTDGRDDLAVPFALFPLDSGLADRISSALSEPRSHGHYLPALRRLRRLIELTRPHLLAHARTSVLLLTDGKPSDQCDPRELKQLIRDDLAQLDGLEQFQLLGFGEADEATLSMMAANVPGGVATCELIQGPGGYTSLMTSVSTFSSSVTISRVSSVSAVTHKKPLRRVSRSFTERLDRYPDCDIELPPRKIGDFLGDLLPLRGSHDLLISRNLLGHGGERNAYLMRFARDNNFTNCDEEWVVKESRHEYAFAQRAHSAAYSHSSPLYPHQRSW